MKADDLREIKRAVKAVKEIARDMAEMFGPSPKDTVHYFPPGQLQPQLPAEWPAQQQPLPGNYTFVHCVDCGAPAMLVRDNNAKCFAVACMECRTISHLESIIEVEDKGYVAGKKA